MKSQSLHNSTKKGFIIFFILTLRPFMKYHSPPLFSVTQHHERRWDPPTCYAWCNYWTSLFIQKVSGTPRFCSHLSRLTWTICQNSCLSWKLDYSSWEKTCLQGAFEFRNSIYKEKMWNIYKMRECKRNSISKYFFEKI